LDAAVSVGTLVLLLGPGCVVRADVRGVDSRKRCGALMSVGLACAARGALPADPGQYPDLLMSLDVTLETSPASRPASTNGGGREVRPGSVVDPLSADFALTIQAYWTEPALPARAA